MTVQSKAREYNGNVDMRHSVMSVKPVDYIGDGQKLLDVIARYGA